MRSMAVKYTHSIQGMFFNGLFLIEFLLSDVKLQF